MRYFGIFDGYFRQTHTTGCNFDLERVWTSTRQGCPEGYTNTLAGAMGALQEIPQECTAIGETHPVRCCADTRPLCRALADGSHSPCHPSASLLTCGELSWEETQSFGGASVCAESDAEAMNGCTNDVTFEQAENICFGAGARLCTVAEIQAHETRNTGCMFNYEYIWTSEVDECQSNQVMTLTGSGTTRVMPGNTYPPAPPVCEDIISGTAAVSCCADASSKCGAHDPESCRDFIVSMWGMCDRDSCGRTCQEAVRNAAQATGCFEGSCAFDTHEWAVAQMVDTCHMDDVYLQPCIAGPIVDYDHTEVAYWPFDDGTASDLVGGHDGEMTGGVTSQFDVQRGYVMNFDGHQGSYIEVPPSEAFDLTDQMSFFAWVKHEDSNVNGQRTNARGVILSHGQGFGSASAFDCSKPTGHPSADGSVCCAAGCRGCGGDKCERRPGGASQCCQGPIASSGTTCGGGAGPPCIMPTDQTGEGNDKIQYQFHLTDGHVTLRMQDTDGSMHTADSQSRIVPGVWTHVGFTLNRNFHVAVYLNGVLDTPRDARMPRFERPTLNSIITIGADTRMNEDGSHVYGHLFKGDIDDVRLFNTAVARPFAAALYDETVSAALIAGAQGVCDQSQALARMQALIAHCCDDAGEECNAAPPDVCSTTCASIYLPFYEDCQHVIPSMFDETGVHNNVGGAFTEQIVMAPWRKFYATCEIRAGSAEHPPPPEGCDMNAVNTACADQSQLNNQALDILCQTPCVTTVASNYDACAASDANSDFIANVEPLMQLCAGDITTRRCYDKFQTFESEFASMCCPNGVCPGADPLSGGVAFLPPTCSRGCASIFMPLFSSCAETLWGQQPAQFQQAVEFEEMCATRIGRFVGEDGYDPCHGIPCAHCNDRNDGTGSGFGFECGWCSHNGGYCSSVCETAPGACVAVDPNEPDQCSSIDNCLECNGACGWCQQGDDFVCSRECTTTANECATEGCKAGNWKVEYFANNALQGAAEKTLCVFERINHQWGAAGVQRLGGINDQFSVRWTGNWAFYPGTTTWTARSDDGSRLFVDDVLIMDHWAECCDTWTSNPIALAEGNHELRFEMHEDYGNAYVQLRLPTCSCRRCFWEQPQVEVHTRRGDNSGTTCNILITFIGENGYTDEKLLHSGMSDGQTHTYSVDVCDIECALRIGTLQKIQLRTDCSDGWKFDAIEVYMPDFRRYHFGSIDEARTGPNFMRRVNSLDIEESDGVASIQLTGAEVVDEAVAGLHGTIRINFEPETSPSPPGYEKDYGQVFGPQTTQTMPMMAEMSWGWNCDLNADGNDYRDREMFADQVLDTLVVLDRDGACPDPVVWEIEIPNGIYTVTVGYSDPAYRVITDGCMLEGEPASVGRVEAASPAEFTRTLTLSDGRLTFSGKYSGVENACEDIAYMIITPGTDDHGGGHCEFPRCAVGAWEANYWTNNHLGGYYSAASCEPGPNINYDWGYDQGPQVLMDLHTDSHITAGVIDQFSARWTGTFDFPYRGSPGSAYQFSVRSDDGSKLWMDDMLIMDHWHDCCTTWLTDPVTVATHFPSHPNQHKIVLWMQEDGGGAYVSLSWDEVQSPCEVGWYAYDRMCWYLGSNHVGWGDDQCPAGSNLASLHDEDHLRFARAIGNDCIRNHDEMDNRFCRMWVGLSDAASECGASWDCEGWSWTDGSPYDYTFWGPGQPNDDEYSTYEQDCGYLNPDYNWLIGDEDCGSDDDHRWRSLCQKPYPGSLTVAGFALWDQWCDAQTDAQQDTAMNNACAERYEGSRAATSAEIAELLGGTALSAHNPDFASFYDASLAYVSPADPPLPIAYSYLTPSLSRLCRSASWGRATTASASMLTTPTTTAWMASAEDAPRATWA